MKILYEYRVLIPPKREKGERIRPFLSPSPQGESLPREAGDLGRGNKRYTEKLASVN
jgi:hypothetical protein